MTKYDVARWMWEHPWAIALNAIICFGIVLRIAFKR